MSEANKHLVTTMLRDLAAARYEAAFAALAEDATWWTPPRPDALGKRAFCEMIVRAHEVYRTHPVFTFHAITAEDDRVAVEAVADATLADGQAYHNWYHFLFRVRDGAIVSVKQYLDTQRAAVLQGVRTRP